MTYFDGPSWLIFNRNMMDPSLPSGLWVCATAEDVEAVGYNACCLPSFGSWADFAQCRGFFAQFAYVFVAAVGERKNELARELNNRIAHTVVVPEDAAFRGCGSVRELLDSCGRLAMEHLLMRAYELPAVGLLSIADVEPPRQNGRRSVSGFPELDRAIGGFSGGELSIWTGKRGEGKSTLLSQLLLEAVAGGNRVCAYSGELPDWRFRQWLYLQAAGARHVVGTVDPTSGATEYCAPLPIQRLIDDWLREELFLYDLKQGSAHDEDSILQIFEYAHRRYCCNVFLVDNIMTARFRQSRDADYYRAQSNFTGRLVDLAKKFDVHVHLVAHPRKTDGKKLLDADDVGGAGDITNRADNVFSLKRLSDLETQEHGFGTVLSVLKNRSRGGSVKVGLDFEGKSRRFYKAGLAPDRQYPWQPLGQQQALVLPRADGGWSGQ